jgi:hypothetical protein
MVTKTIEERERNNIVRKDLMQYLIQLRNSSDNKTDDDEWKINSSGGSIEAVILKILKLIRIVFQENPSKA